MIGSNKTTQIPTLRDKNASRRKAHQAERARFYKLTEHGQQVAKFYNSTLWKATRLAQLSKQPLCELSLSAHKVVPADQVHHIIKFADLPDEQVQWQLFLDPDNLMSIAGFMHQRVHNDASALTEEQLLLLKERKDKLFKKYLLNGVCLVG